MKLLFCTILLCAGCCYNFYRVLQKRRTEAGVRGKNVTGRNSRCGAVIKLVFMLV